MVVVLGGVWRGVRTTCRVLSQQITASESLTNTGTLSREYAGSNSDVGPAKSTSRTK